MDGIWASIIKAEGEIVPSLRYITALYSFIHLCSKSIFFMESASNGLTDAATMLVREQNSSL